MWVLYLFMALLLIGLGFGYVLDFWAWNCEQADRKAAAKKTV